LNECSANLPDVCIDRRTLGLDTKTGVPLTLSADPEVGNKIRHDFSDKGWFV
jgi:hypothetical protein